METFKQLLLSLAFTTAILNIEATKRKIEEVDSPNTNQKKMQKAANQKTDLTKLSDKSRFQANYIAHLTFDSDLPTELVYAIIAHQSNIENKDKNGTTTFNQNQLYGPQGIFKGQFVEQSKTLLLEFKHAKATFTGSDLETTISNMKKGKATADDCNFFLQNIDFKAMKNKLVNLFHARADTHNPKKYQALGITTLQQVKEDCTKHARRWFTIFDLLIMWGASKETKNHNGKRIHDLAAGVQHITSLKGLSTKYLPSEFEQYKTFFS